MSQYSCVTIVKYEQFFNLFVGDMYFYMIIYVNYL